MSTNGTRKQTPGWEGPSGGLVIDEAPPASSATITIDSAAIVVDEPPAPPPLPKRRPRLSTLGRFNNEMAILERPLEGDIAYIDERTPRRWRHIAAFIVTAAIVGGGGVLVLSRLRATSSGHIEPSSPAVATVASAASSARVEALQPTAVPSAAASTRPSQPVAIAATQGAPADASAAGDSAHLRASHSASGKVKPPPGHGHSKHARAGTGKSGRHRAGKHAGTSKHLSRPE